MLYYAALFIMIGLIGHVLYLEGVISIADLGECTLTSQASLYIA